MTLLTVWAREDPMNIKQNNVLKIMIDLFDIDEGLINSVSILKFNRFK